MLRSFGHSVIMLACVTFLIAACNSLPSSSLSSSDCPYISTNEVAAAWGKAVTATSFRVDNTIKCQYSSTDAQNQITLPGGRTSVDYVEVDIQDYGTTNDATNTMQGWSSGQGGAPANFGDKAVWYEGYVGDTNRSPYLVIQKGKYIVIMIELGLTKSTKDVLGKIAEIILSNITKS